MSDTIKLNDDRSSDCTMLPDLFIEHHMPSANGEFVKIYIYLLNLIQKKRGTFSLSSAADVFSCTENDILRALLFWEKRGLLTLDRKENTVAGVRLTQGRTDAGTSPGMDAGTGAESVSGSDDTGRGNSRNNSRRNGRSTGRGQYTLSNDRRRQLLSEEAEVAEILMFAEEYLGRTLSSSDQNRLLYLYDELHFSVDLLDYLVEYCVLKEKRSMHYIEKVGLEWYNDGVKTVAEAKERTSRWNRDYYTILRAFGISNRDPVSREKIFMRRWLQEYGFTMDLIREACERTVAQTGRASFDYAEKILHAWHGANVHTLKDVEALDAEHSRRMNASESDSRNSGGTASKKPNRFNNFRQRDYDYGALEQALLGRNPGTETAEEDNK